MQVVTDFFPSSFLFCVTLAIEIKRFLMRLVTEFFPTVYLRGYMFVLEGSKSVDEILRCLLSGHSSIKKKNECQVEYVQSI